MVVGEKCPVTIKCGEGLLSQLLAFDPQGGVSAKVGLLCSLPSLFESVHLRGPAVQLSYILYPLSDE